MDTTVDHRDRTLPPASTHDIGSATSGRRVRRDLQRKDATRPLDGSKQHQLRGSLGNPDVGERDVRRLQHNDDQTQYRDDPIQTALQSEHLLPETNDVHVDNVESDDLSRSRIHPTTRR